MVKTLAINENNDIYLGADGNIVVVEGITAVEQACQMAAQTLLGEMIYSSNQGVPYNETVFQVGAPILPQFDAGLRVAILAVPGVTGIKSLIIQQVEDALTYNATITTEFGEGTLDGNVTV
jgi:PPE-repeat protein